jgi:hypothetical protein
MDPLDQYRQVVQDVLTEYARIPYAYGEIRRETVFDPASDRYLLMLVGWEGIRRVHGCLIHIDIIDGRIWIERDGTERGVARELLDAGVPRDRIVLAFHAPEVRGEAELAVT